MTDAEHRALDERLDILSWGIALIVLAIVLSLPGTHSLWNYLIPFGLVFIAMSIVRRQIRTRRDTEGLILGITAVVLGFLDFIRVDLRFFPVVPTILIIVGLQLSVSAILSKRIRTDPSRPPEGR